MSSSKYPISERVQSLLKNLEDENSKYYPISKLNNYNFINNPDMEDIQIELCKFLGFDITQNSIPSIYNKDSRTYSSLSGLKHKYLRKKILYHFKSYMVNKKYLKSSNIGYYHKEKRLDEYFNIIKHENIALREYLNTEIIGMDIDTHNYFDKKNYTLVQRRFLFEELCQNIYSTIKENIPLHVLYVETSRINRGLHIYFKLNNLHNKKLIENNIKLFLEKEFTGIVVEYRTKSHPLRLPLSGDYVYRDVKTFNKKYKLNKILPNIFKNIKEDLKNNNTVLSHLEQLTFGITIPEFPEDKTSIFFRPSMVHPKYKNKEIPFLNITDKYKIYAGNRVGGDATHWRLVNWCIHNGKSLDEFVDLTLKCNVNSKDISTWNHTELYNECKKMYEYAWKKFLPMTNYMAKDNPDEFHSNLYLLKAKEKKLVKSTIYKLKKILPNNNFKDRLLKDSEICFSEFIGKIEYEILNPRKIFKNAKITKEKRKELLEGYQFPKEYLDKVKLTYNIKSNIKTIFNLFKTYFLELIIHSNGSSYIPSLSSCKQYRMLWFLTVASGILRYTLSTQTKEGRGCFYHTDREEKHIIMLLKSTPKTGFLGVLDLKPKYFNLNMEVIQFYISERRDKLLKFLERKGILA